MLMCLFSLSGIVYFLNDDPRPLGYSPSLFISPLHSLKVSTSKGARPFLEFFNGKLFFHL